MSTLMHPALHSRASAGHQSASGLPGELASYVRSSRAIASMLPPLLSSGVLTLVITAVMHLMWAGLTDGFVSVWMESWLTAWPIAFPVAYLSGPVLARVAAGISAPAIETARVPGLACGDIVDASARVTAINGYRVLRNLKPAHDFSAA